MASWDNSGIGVLPRLQLDFDDIANKIETSRESGHEPTQLIINFKSGDIVLGIPVEYKTASR